MDHTFLETRFFSARWHKRQDSEALRLLQNELMADPLRGDPIPGCGFLRKYRFGDALRGKGKRGGLRVIYMHTPEVSRIDLITVYGKDEADDLTAQELRHLCELGRIIRTEALAQVQARTLKSRTNRNA